MNGLFSRVFGNVCTQVQLNEARCVLFELLHALDAYDDAGKLGLFSPSLNP
ncbi:MAG: hypothetical protein P4L81_00370 [Candidatus Pacebacteria bacterium]|nr:hypothetical protein [Candidatus Paceibacterota bacterium]